MGFNNHAKIFTPPYYLDVDNPLSDKYDFPTSFINIFPEIYARIMLNAIFRIDSVL